jgi:hypothetical protein
LTGLKGVYVEQVRVIKKDANSSLGSSLGFHAYTYSCVHSLTHT